MTELTFRDATPADGEAIAEIYNASIVAGGATMDRETKSAEYFGKQIANFSSREAILLLERGEDVQGWGIIKKYSDRAGYRFCCETAVYLRRDLTGRRLGTRIKLALIERCRRYGYHHLVAKIFADNVGSIQYNKKLGYEVVGTQKEIGYTAGRWQDVVIMQLVLDDVPPEIPAELRQDEENTEEPQTNARRADDR